MHQNQQTSRNYSPFLGMISFYSRFLRDKASIAEPLHRLLDNEAKWRWEDPHKAAFNRLKDALRECTVLAHYDDSRPLMLSCDASPYGLGAVLAQLDGNGQEIPVAFASRTLGKCERNYSQLDREGLAIVFGVAHFHQYIAGRNVLIVTDHKPLFGIMCPRKKIQQVLSPRMIRWCVILSAYLRVGVPRRKKITAYPRSE